MKQQTLVIIVLGAVLLANGVGFTLYRSKKAVTPPPATPLQPPKAVPPTPVPDERAENEQNARARRAAGVAALEAGDYDKALINFTEAQSLIGEAARVTDLLKITEDLRNRSREKKAEAVATPEPTPPAAPAGVAARPPQPAPKSTKPQQPTRPTSAPERPVAETRPTEAPAQLVGGSGMLLVSTTPRGLLVQVDGAATDLTPMRAPIKVGAHRVALYDGDRKLYETSVDVQEGQVSTVLKDLTVEMAPKVAVVETRTEVRPEQPTRAEPRPAPAPVPTAPAEPRPAPAPAPPPPAPTSPVAEAVGGLEISSPGLYGEIWVNGRPQGFPPLTLKSLPAGPAKVEVRVNGAVKRTANVTVEAGQVKPVRVVR